jgi:arylsulfatase A-like enzyme
MDFFTMALELAGVRPPSDRVIDGRNPLPTLKGEAASPHEALYFLYRGGRAVREGRHKLIRPRGADSYRLYDLANDIGETNNIIDENPDVADRLKRKYERWLEDVRG